MVDAWRNMVTKVQRIFRLLALLLLLRIVAGVVMIAFFDRDAVAWGYEITFILIAAVIVYLLAAVAVRRWAPGRRAS